MTEETVTVPAAASTSAATTVPDVNVKNNPMNEPTLMSKIMVGGYLLIFSWLFVHTVLSYWDLLIPWNITITQYLRFYGAFILYLVCLAFSTWYYWKIWSTQEWSHSGATRWPLIASNSIGLCLLTYSGMVDEPFSRIGSGWFIDDLRYPAFMSQPNGFIFLSVFITDASLIFSCNDEGGETNFMFRLWRMAGEKEKWLGWRENIKGLFGLAYIYFGYWFIFMVVTRSWIERIILLIVITLTRSCFSNPKAFFQKRQFFILSFVPIYALVRGYYSYYELSSYGSPLAFVLKLVYCLSQVVMFAGWYTGQASQLGEWTWPFLKNDDDGSGGDKTETEGDASVIGAAETTGATEIKED